MTRGTATFDRNDQSREQQDEVPHRVRDERSLRPGNHRSQRWRRIRRSRCGPGGSERASARNNLPFQAGRKQRRRRRTGRHIRDRRPDVHDRRRDPAEGGTRRSRRGYWTSAHDNGYRQPREPTEQLGTPTRHRYELQWRADLWSGRGGRGNDRARTARPSRQGRPTTTGSWRATKTARRRVSTRPSRRSGCPRRSHSRRPRCCSGLRWSRFPPNGARSSGPRRGKGRRRRKK